MEKCCTYALSNNVPLGATRNHFHFLLLHDLFELGTNLPHFSHGLDMDKVVLTPLTRISVGFPLLVHIQVGQMVGFRHLKFLPRSIRIFFPAFGSKENGGHGQHGDYKEKSIIKNYAHAGYSFITYNEYVKTALHFLRDDEHF